MLIVLLIPFFASAEWVEISQNHYRKEPYRNVMYLSTTTAKNDMYGNHSISEHQWSKGYVDRVPSIAGMQLERTKEGERGPSVNIQRIALKHEDLTAVETPEHGFQMNKVKSGNSIKTTVGYENMDDVSYFKTTQYRPAVGREHPKTHKNSTRNKFTINESNKDNSYKQIDPDNVKIEKVASDTYGSEMYLENLSRTPQIDVTEKDNVAFHKLAVDKKTQNTHEKASNDKQKHTRPKHENETKSNGIDTIIKFFKVVSQTIQRGTRRNISDKVRFLEGLKESLLANIEERIESVFPDDNAQHRRRRSSKAESRGHVEFPSSESALMSISFLTFAVFLIKLVLQVIHTYKAKTMMVTPAVVATVGRARKVLNTTPHN